MNTMVESGEAPFIESTPLIFPVLNTHKISVGAGRKRGTLRTSKQNSPQKHMGCYQVCKPGPPAAVAWVLDLHRLRWMFPTMHWQP